METSFNEEASLQAASDTCHNATGRGVRGILSSAFGGFLNVKGFYRVFILVLGGFCLIHNTNKTKTFGRAFGFPLVFPVSFSFDP